MKNQEYIVYQRSPPYLFPNMKSSNKTGQKLGGAVKTPFCQLTYQFDSHFLSWFRYSLVKPTQILTKINFKTMSLVISSVYPFIVHQSAENFIQGVKSI
jgi:hypothetical protein